MTVTQIAIASTYKAQTKHAFPLVEAIAVAKLLVQGDSKADVRRKVLEEDLFELRSLSSREGALQIVMRLLDEMPHRYVELLAQGDSDTKRFTLLFLVLREHRLLRELVAEVLIEKRKGLISTVTATDLKAFFDNKRSQETLLAQWSDTTFQKATSNAVLVLVRSGLLQPIQTDSKKGSYEIRAVPTPMALRQQLISDGYEPYLALMLN